MAQVSMRPRESELILHVEQKDSMGRTAEVRRQMERNDPRPVFIGSVHENYAQAIAAHQSSYPKAMYRLALRKGEPNGDLASPDYPVPFDLAVAMGMKGQTINQGVNKAVIIKKPYRTISCGVISSNGIDIDIEASRAMEKKLLAEGWVDSLAKVVGLPKAEEDDLADDPLPQIKNRVQASA